MLSKVVTKEPPYKKDDMDAISRIAENYPTAVVNAWKTVNNLLSQGLPDLTIQMRETNGCVHSA